MAWMKGEAGRECCVGEQINTSCSPAPVAKPNQKLEDKGDAIHRGQPLGLPEKPRERWGMDVGGGGQMPQHSVYILIESINTFF